MIALLAIFAAIGLVTATGAFSSVSAERSVTVDVAGDDAALLQLTSGSGYAEGQSTGAISFDFAGASTDGDNIGSQGAEGLNDEAITNIDYILNVTNNGDRPVTLTVTNSGDDGILTVYNSTAEAPTSVGSTPPAFTSAELGSGSDVSLGFSFDTSQSSSTSFSITITIEADANS